MTENYKLDEIHPIYVNMPLDIDIVVSSAELKSDINPILHNKLCKTVEGYCIAEGFVRPNSVKIISRSVGRLNLNLFNGNVNYAIRYTADICNPKRDQLIECIVIENNKSNVKAYIEDPEYSPINIYLTRENHLNDIKFTNLKKGDKIMVKIIKSKFEYRDTSITAVAKFIKLLI